MKHMLLNNFRWLGMTLLLCLLLVFTAAADHPQWKLVKEGHGIKVYTASVNSEFKSIKVVAELDGTVEKLKSVLMDIDNQPEWVYSIKQSYILKKVNSHELLYYVETDLPWPASNRDAVVRLKLKEDFSKRTLTIISAGEPKAYPIQPGNVRVPHYTANWQVKALEKDKIHITYHLEVDPGGILSSWIVNLFVSKGPYESFRRLSEQLKK